ncbi:MAG: DNA-directed RNA polymerase [Candidatus Nanohaloarchaeota archaeon QJJ-7]|nr:DNA-directed RNA polymerase [Candidatus Nanohaloarchaeota archaeon QJJ-7]
MFYEVRFQDRVKVPPQFLGGDVEEAVSDSLGKIYENRIDAELGSIVSILSVDDIGEGEIEPEEPGAFYPVTCKAVTYLPELHEVVLGEISEITEFGAFVSLGPIEALCHVSQIMDDYVSYNEEQNALSGEDGDRTLQPGDVVKARITAVSLSDGDDHKVNLTMRQPGLGKLEWIEEDVEEAEEEEEDNDG